MSFFVTVTFDLRKANSSLYSKIRRGLGQIKFSKLIGGKKTIKRKLPHNTFAAKFDNSDFQSPSEACTFVRAELGRIFKKHFVRGKYFVVAGRRWAWKTGEQKGVTSQQSGPLKGIANPT